MELEIREQRILGIAHELVLKLDKKKSYSFNYFWSVINIEYEKKYNEKIEDIHTSKEYYDYFRSRLMYKFSWLEKPNFQEGNDVYNYIYEQTKNQIKETPLEYKDHIKILEEKLNCLEKNPVIRIEKEWMEILTKTDNVFEYKNLLYDYFFVNTCLKISKGIFLIGFFVENQDEKTSNDNETINKVKENKGKDYVDKNIAINCYVVDFNILRSFTYQHDLKSFKDKDFNMELGTYNTGEIEDLEKIGKIAFNFIFNICDMLNNKQVEVIETYVSEKKRNKKIKRNMPPGSEVVISLEPNQELKRYISKFNSDSQNKLSHKFLVRGHYSYLRDKDHYSNAYSKLETDELPENMFYDENSQLIKCWKKPYYKGEGIAIVKDVNLK